MQGILFPCVCFFPFKYLLFVFCQGHSFHPICRTGCFCKWGQGTYNKILILSHAVCWLSSPRWQQKPATVFMSRLGGSWREGAPFAGAQTHTHMVRCAPKGIKLLGLWKRHAFVGLAVGGLFLSGLRSWVGRNVLVNHTGREQCGLEAADGASFTTREEGW